MCPSPYVSGCGHVHTRQDHLLLFLALNHYPRSTTSVVAAAAAVAAVAVIDFDLLLVV